jgi:hypothetical protein
MAETIDIGAAKREGQGHALYIGADRGSPEGRQRVSGEIRHHGRAVPLGRHAGAAPLHDGAAGRPHGADVLVSSDPAAVLDLAAKGLFVPFKPDGFDKVPAGLNDPGRPLRGAARKRDLDLRTHRSLSSE